MRTPDWLRGILILGAVCLAPGRGECVVGKLLEEGVTLAKGERWSLARDERILSAVEIRGQLLKGNHRNGGGWKISFYDSFGDSIAEVAVTIPQKSYDGIGDSATEVTVSPFYRADNGTPADGDVGRICKVDGAAVSVAMVESGEGMAEIWSGDKTLGLLCVIPVGKGVASFLVTPDDSMEMVSVNVRDRDVTDNLTEWNEENLARRFAVSDDFREGFYDYLDSDIDTERCRLGGAYRIGLVRDGKGGYEIVYLSGAEDNSRNWVAGMVKGGLRPTIFEGHYDLWWRDSDFAEDIEELWAQLDGTVLSLHFPKEKAVVRFSRSRQNR